MDNKQNKRNAVETIDGSNLYRDSTDFRSERSRENGCECAPCNAFRYGLMERNSEGNVRLIGPNTAKIMELAADYLDVILADMVPDIAATFSTIALKKITGSAISQENFNLLDGASGTFQDINTARELLYKIAFSIHALQTARDTETQRTIADILSNAFGEMSEKENTENDKRAEDFRARFDEWKRSQANGETD